MVDDGIEGKLSGRLGSCARIAARGEAIGCEESERSSNNGYADEIGFIHEFLRDVRLVANGNAEDVSLNEILRFRGFLEPAIGLEPMTC